MDNSKPWLIVEIVHPELRPTRFARRAEHQPVDVDSMLFAAGFATAAHDKSLPYPKRYPLVVYIWSANEPYAERPAPSGMPGPTPGLKKTRARNATYAEARDRAMALRKAVPWGPQMRCRRAMLAAEG